MKTNQGRALAALSLALLWLFASPTRVAAFECQLVFEAIPSEDVGPITGQLVKHNLAGKNFKAWGVFTAVQAAGIVVFLNENFGEKMTFTNLKAAMGGFQGKSSPNAIIDISVDDSPEGDALGELITPVAAAVGFILIQDGTVANCINSVGKFGGSFPKFTVLPEIGFHQLDASAVRAIYSAMVAANDNLNIGYTFADEEMLMLDFNGLVNQLNLTNAYFNQVYTSEVSIEFKDLGEQSTIYVENNWAEDPEGLALLEKVPDQVLEALSAARVRYRIALKEFSVAKD